MNVCRGQQIRQALGGLQVYKAHIGQTLAARHQVSPARAVAAKHTNTTTSVSAIVVGLGAIFAIGLVAAPAGSAWARAVFGI